MDNSLDDYDIDAYYSSQDDGDAGVWNVGARCFALFTFQGV